MSDVERDLADARVLFSDSQKKSEGQKYRKAAEIILLKILYLDPSHAEAKALLATVRASAEPPQSAPAAVEAPKPKPPKFEELRFTAQPSPVEKKPQPKDPGTTRKLPILLAGFILLAGGGMFFFRPHTASSAPAPEVVVETPAPVAPLPSPGITDAKAVQSDSSVASSAPADSRVLLGAASPLVVPTQTAAPGFLAVNSTTSAEIYMGGKYLGETPTTLQLPAGAQTLEYRHGDLRTVMTHDIKTRETINALVTFDVTVQINARPWAQVFVDGAVRKPLGQTPLSSVRVPIGSVLAFENPNFPSKSYRITEKDSSIQVVFP